MDKKHFLDLKLPPPVLFCIFAGIIWLLARALPRAGFALPGNRLIAAAIASAGLLFAAPAILSFLRAGTNLHPHDPHKSTILVVTGVYSITRNPMYLSLLIVLFAWAIFLSNVAALVPLPFFVVYLTRFQIKPEERALTALFGKEYEEYCRRVPRWL